MQARVDFEPGADERWMREAAGRVTAAACSGVMVWWMGAVSGESEGAGCAIWRVLLRSPWVGGSVRLGRKSVFIIPGFCLCTSRAAGRRQHVRTKSG